MKTKTMKKIITLIMGVLLMFSLAACGKEQQVADGGAEKPSSETAERNGVESETPKEAAGVSSVEGTENENSTDGNISDTTNTENMENTNGKTLVVYYSASGNIKEAAEYIAAATGGELFELEPEEAYTEEDLDWTDKDSRVCREHENEEERDITLVSVEVPDWDSYETVFIGYPIWWGEAPHIVYSLVENVSLKKKTVIPFSTSISSGLGSSGKHLKTKANISSKTKWMKGRNFYDVPSQKTVNKWVKSMKY